MSEETGKGGAMRVDTDLIRALADLLTEKDLSEIEVEDADRRFVVKRQLTAAPATSAAAPPAAPPATHSADAVTSEESAANHPGTVKSPMVGTVYLAGEPGSPPFAAPGTRVEQGDTLLIVEAMKVMNPITAPRAGIVKQVLVQDAQPIEYDQPLMILE